MNLRFFITCSSAAVLLFFVWACSATTLQNVWKDDSYSARVNSILILGATKKRAIRQMFESELSRQLQEKGVNAIPSFPLFSTDDVVNKEDIMAKALEKNIDSVIVAKVLDVKTYHERVTDIHRVPIYLSDYRYSDRYRTYIRPGGWYGDYWAGYTTVRHYNVNYTVSHAETGLYLLEGEKMVWSILTETETSDDIDGSIADMVKVVVDQLEKDGMI